MENINTNIENEAPILFGLKKENTLKVPNAYFDKLPEELLKIASKKQLKVINLKRWFIYSSSIAALIVFGFFSLQQYNHNIELKEFNNSFNELTVMDFEEDLFILEDALFIDFNDDHELNNLIDELY
ncbi:MAG TPA: hypothetical protein EYG80_05255 [Flavobacteriaceae bacterium]|nr:hypothetical protein [Flavobacteriaceae bacterium]HIP27043.1 hypothetical protein [Flavobacteriaceae bacterium]